MGATSDHPGPGLCRGLGQEAPQPDGIHPEVIEPAFYALPREAARGISQAKLIELGVIREQLRMMGASYGRVTPKLF
jgi:hypothetical protein